MNNVTDLKTSKQLVLIMAGVRTLFNWYWAEAYDEKKGFYKTWILDSRTCPVGMGASTKIIPAYSLDDLLSVIPSTIERKGELWGFSMTHVMVMYKAIMQDSCTYLHHLKHEKGESVQALADMLLWLGEQGHMTKEGK